MGAGVGTGIDGVRFSYLIAASSKKYTGSLSTSNVFTQVISRLLVPILGTHKFFSFISASVLKIETARKGICPKISIKAGKESDAVGFYVTRSVFLGCGRIFCIPVGTVSIAVGFFAFRSVQGPTRSDLMRCVCFYPDAFNCKERRRFFP
jgi:hypothetical protein